MRFLPAMTFENFFNRESSNEQKPDFDQPGVHDDLLDAIDSLRAADVNHYVDLPEVVVCGDQNSGKSSVLSGISGVELPVKDALCTRCPIELILRKKKDYSITVSIKAGPNASEDQRKIYDEFKPDWANRSFAQIVETARSVMGIGPGPDGKTFSSDILKVEIRGPHQPNLTLVDLPGLFRAESRDQSAADIKLVKNLVLGYISRPRSIILAVVHGGASYDNQEVTQFTRKFDPSGERTLGVITKPDMLYKNTDTEQKFLQLAKNDEIQLRLGWHVLRNRDPDTENVSLQERNRQEAQFFTDRKIWSSLPKKQLGIVSLKARLGAVLKGQIISELPRLKQDIHRQLEDCEKKKKALGEPRDTLTDQKLYLIQLSKKFSDILRYAIDGSYDHEFFGDPNSEFGYEKRLRAIIQNKFVDFRELMSKEGHQKEIIDENDTNKDEGLNDDTDNVGRDNDRRISRQSYLEEVRELMRKNRGRELPGTCNPLIISDLFVQQSLPWQELALLHAKDLVNCVKQTLKSIVSRVTDDTTRKRILTRVILPKLDEISKDFETKVLELLQPHKKGYHAITYNSDFIRSFQELESERESKRLESSIQEFIRINPHRVNSFPLNQANIKMLLGALKRKFSDDMDLEACSDYTNLMQAYYKIALGRFIDDFATLATESGLLKRISTIFDPEAAFQLDENMVSIIASESEESLEQRRLVDIKERCLLSGLNTLNEACQEKELDDSYHQWNFGSPESNSEVLVSRPDSPDRSIPAENDDEGATKTATETATEVAPEDASDAEDTGDAEGGADEDAEAERERLMSYLQGQRVRYA